MVLKLDCFLTDALDLETDRLINVFVELKLVSDKDWPQADSDQVWKAPVPDLIQCHQILILVQKSVKKACLLLQMGGVLRLLPGLCGGV